MHYINFASGGAGNGGAGCLSDGGWAASKPAMLGQRRAATDYFRRAVDYTPPLPAQFHGRVYHFMPR